MELDDPITDEMTKWGRIKNDWAFPVIALICALMVGATGWAIGIKHVMESQEYKLGKAILNTSDQHGPRPYTITIE